MTADKKEKPKYNVVQNIRYAFLHIWAVDKRYFLAYVPQIPINVFLPLAAVYFPSLLIRLIERRSSDAEMLLTIGVYCFVLMAVGTIGLLCNTRISSTDYVFSFTYQDKVSEKHYKMDYENTENPKVEDMRHRTYSGGMAGENIPKELNGLLINLLGIFTYGGIIGALNPLILLLLFVTNAINYATLTYVRRYTEKNKDNWAHLDRKNNYLRRLSSQYEYAKDIKIYNMRVWLLDLTDHFHKLRMSWHKRIYNRNFMSGAVDGGLRLIRDGVAYAVLITMFLDGRIDVGGFIFYFGAIAGFSNWLSTIVNRFNTISSQSLDISRLRAYLETEDKFNRGPGVPLPSASEIPYEIEFKSLTYYYPGSENPAVDGIDLTIKKGERLAVVGVNGAGKSTLVKLLCGLYYPSSGSVVLNGRDANEYNIEAYYTQFSVVFQDIGLLAVPIGRFIAGNVEVDRARARRALELAGLDTVVAGLPNDMDTTLIKGVFDDGIDLSGGEKQKLMLARALYKDAPVVVLDEPTAALDPIAENDLYMKYADLTKGKTSVYISHRLSSTRFCDHIIFLQDGKIAESGSHIELMEKDGLYAHMFNVQSHYYKEDVTHER